MEGFVMDKAEQPTITQADRDAAAAYWKASMIGSSMTQKLYKSGEFDSSLIVQAFARHRTTSLAAQDDVTLVEELRAEISNLEAALTQIAGSHWERYGIGQTDIEDVPDLSAEEAMNVARDALSNTPAPSLAAQDEGLISDKSRIERLRRLVHRWIGQGQVLGIVHDMDLQCEIDDAIAWANENEIPAPEFSLAAQDGLVEALEAMLRAVCGETGFANAVRGATGKAYPWPALDMAEEKARKALSAIKEQHHD